MNDRITQLIVLVVVAAGLIAGVMLTPTINDQRRERQLSYDLEVGDGANPEYAFLASLGSLRGMAVHALWYRAEQLKQEGKFYEANNLAEMITTLQPRFPQVWLFQAWNMAYNISVKTNTPEERWDWVNKGMNLLRSQGIPNNPNSPTLYKELSWILSHKMGGQTDDMNVYYKREFCEEWHNFLGGEPYRSVRPKSEFRTLPREEFDPYIHGEWITTLRFGEMIELSDQYMRRPDARDDTYGQHNYYAVLSRDAKDKFLNEHPEISALVQEMQQVTMPNGESAGLGMNTRTMLGIGKFLAIRNAGYNINDPRVMNEEVFGKDGMAVMQWLINRDNVNQPIDFDPMFEARQPANPPADRPKPIALGPMLELLRAERLINEYHMDPRFMLRCMEQFGPLDWRHVHAHACYWSALGTVQAQANLIDLTRIDLINTDRATLHAVQGLVQGGKIYYRPRIEPLARSTNGMVGSGVISLEPDPRLIPAYGIALGFTQERIESGKFGELNTDTYEQGYENFLQTAVVFYYYGGELGKARQTFQQLQEEYGDSPRSTSAQDGEYELSISDFALIRLEDELGYQDEYIIRSLLRWALVRGVVNQNLQLTSRLLNDARNKYDKVMEQRRDAGRSVGLQGTGVQGRRELPEWPVLLIEEFSKFMTNDGYFITARATIWQRASAMLAQMSDELPLHFIVYSSFREQVRQQMAAQGRDPAAFQELFPVPDGYDQWYDAVIQQQQDQGNQPPPTIRRQ